MPQDAPAPDRMTDSTQLNALQLAQQIACPDCRALAGKPCTKPGRPCGNRGRLARWLREEGVFTYPEQIARHGFPDEVQ